MMFSMAWIGVGHGMLGLYGVWLFLGMLLSLFVICCCACSLGAVLEGISSVLGFGFYGFLVVIVSFGFPFRRMDF
jgi:hypothetical protein